MKFIVPTDFSNAFISRLNKKEVSCLYGKLAADFIGGARLSFMLPSISRRCLQDHVAKTHQNGLEFNYLLNSSCLNNNEFTISGQKQIRSLLDWLMKIKVDSVTVAIPYLAQIIKKNYPDLKIHVSVRANVDSVLKARYWQDLGADVIVLQSTALNRDFEILRLIRKNIKCKLALIANDTCLYKCPLLYYHAVTGSHGSQINNGAKGFHIDYCVINCKKLRLENDTNIIRAVWIRPEDSHYYEELGIDYLKFSGRNKDSDFISRIVEAYTARHYEGNLADLFPFYSNLISLSGFKKHMHYARFLFKPFAVNVFRIYKIFKDEPLKIYINNRALDGFLEFFVKEKCKRGLCEECGYCAEVAKKSIKIDTEYQKNMILKYKNILEYMTLGKLFKYF